MVVEFSNNITKRYYLWSSFKNECNLRNGSMQYDNDNDDYYIIWFYNGNEIFICNIWKIQLPEDIASSLNYDQTQNDLDKVDFENNYLTTINAPLVKVAVTGAIAQAPAKGLGGFAPDPSNNPYQPNPDEIVSLYVDGEGSLVTRGAIITDEGSLREDFTGSSLTAELTGTLSFTNGSNIITGTGTIFKTELSRDSYIKLSSDDDGYYAKVLRVPTDTTLQIDGEYLGSSGSGAGYKTRWLVNLTGTTPGSISVANSEATISSGTDSSSGIGIYRNGDYLPIVSTWSISVSQRIEGQSSFIGFRDNINNPSMYCDVVFEGTDNTIINFRSAWNNDEESSIVSLPAGLDTSQLLRYKIDMCIDYCSLMINGVLVARHERHVPDPYVEMILCSGIVNNGATSSTNLVIDTVLFLNQDQIQISSNYSSPISVITKEDQHTITGKLTTSSSTADQVILSYTVPAGKVFYIIGYRIETSGTLNGSPVKIGRNTMTNIPNSPGSIDDNIFRVIHLAAGSSTGDVDFGSNPRKIGVGGDVINITVTPSGLLSSTWYASLDFVLR